jgi:CheY-like chemotaxis protein
MAAATTSRRRNGSLVRDGESVLVVDDDEVLRSLLAVRLCRHELFVAASVSEAIEVLERETVDVIVSDYSMPAATGLSLLAYVRRRGLRARFVLTSVNFPDGVEREARAAGAVSIDKGELVSLL